MARLRDIDASLEIEASDRVLKVLQQAIAEAPRKTRKTAVRVLNRALKSGKSAASKKIRETVNRPKKVIDQRITTRVETEIGLVGSLRVAGQRFELVDYMSKAQIAAQWKRQKSRRKGHRRAVPPLKVKVYKNREQVQYPDAFVNIGRRDRKWHVLKREDAQREPIFIQYGPPITEQFARGLSQFAAEQAARFNAEMLRILSQQVDIT